MSLHFSREFPDTADQLTCVAGTRKGKGRGKDQMNLPTTWIVIKRLSVTKFFGTESKFETFRDDLALVGDVIFSPN